MTTPYTITLSNGTTTFDIYPLETNGPNNRSVPRPALTSILSPHPLGGTNYFTAGGDLTYRFLAGFVFDVTDVNGAFTTPASGTYTTAVGGSYVVGGPNPYTEIPTSTTIPRGYFNIVGVNLGSQTWTIAGNFASEFAPGNFININENGANGVYTIASAANVGPNTDITVVEVIAVTATSQGYLSHREFPVVSSVPGLGGSVTFGGDLTPRFPVGSSFTLTTSPTPTTFTVQSAVYGVNTTITVAPTETIPPITTERVNINFLQSLPIGFISYTVPAPAGVSTPLTLPGRGVLNWGQKLEQSMVHILENFADNTAPVSPLDGQLWFDTTVNTLYVRHSGTWNPLAGGSVIEPLNQLVYGTGIGVDSSPDLTYDPVFGNFTLNPPTQVGGIGGTAIIFAGDGDAGGGDIFMFAGDTNAPGFQGGAVQISAGNAPSGGVGGQVQITGGSATGVGFFSGGGINIQGGTGDGTGTGGPINITGGNSNNGSAGSITLTAGVATGLGANGNISFQTFGGTYAFSSTGEFLINTLPGAIGEVLTSNGPGTPPSWQTPSGGLSRPAYEVVYGTGPSVTSNSLFTIDPTNGAYTFGPYSVGILPGNINITGAQSTGTDAGGAVIIQSGNGGAISGDSGSININTGIVTSGATGSINIFTSTGVGAQSGSISIATGSSDGTVGNIDILGGAASGANSGGININGSDAIFGSTADGGPILIRAGSAQNATGQGGNVTIESGTSAALNGGTVRITGRTGDNNGGQVILEALESLSGTGLDGRIINRAYGGTRFRNFDVNSFSGNCEEIKFILTTTTTTNTLTEMFLDTTLSRRMVLPDGATWKYRIDLAARRTDLPNESAAYIIEGCIDRQTGALSTAFVGTPLTTILAEDTPSWDVVVDADTSNGALRIRVQGDTGSTIRWTAFVNITQAS